MNDRNKTKKEALTHLKLNREALILIGQNRRKNVLDLGNH